MGLIQKINLYKFYPIILTALLNTPHDARSHSILKSIQKYKERQTAVYQKRERMLNRMHDAIQSGDKTKILALLKEKKYKDAIQSKEKDFPEAQDVLKEGIGGTIINFFLTIYHFIYNLPYRYNLIGLFIVILPLFFIILSCILSPPTPCDILMFIKRPHYTLLYLLKIIFYPIWKLYVLLFAILKFLYALVKTIILFPYNTILFFSSLKSKITNISPQSFSIDWYVHIIYIKNKILSFLFNIDQYIFNHIISFVISLFKFVIIILCFSSLYFYNSHIQSQVGGKPTTLMELLASNGLNSEQKTDIALSCIHSNQKDYLNRKGVRVEKTTHPLLSNIVEMAYTKYPTLNIKREILGYIPVIGSLIVSIQNFFYSNEDDYIYIPLEYFFAINDYTLTTALHIAVEKNLQEVVTALLDAGIEINPVALQAEATIQEKAPYRPIETTYPLTNLLRKIPPELLQDPQSTRSKKINFDPIMRFEEMIQKHEIIIPGSSNLYYSSETNRYTTPLDLAQKGSPIYQLLRSKGAKHYHELPAHQLPKLCKQPLNHIIEKMSCFSIENNFLTKTIYQIYRIHIQIIYQFITDPKGSIKKVNQWMRQSRSPNIRMFYHLSHILWFLLQSMGQFLFYIYRIAIAEEELILFGYHTANKEDPIF